MHGRAGHVTKSEVLLAEFSFNEIFSFYFFFFFIEREVLVRDGGRGGPQSPLENGD